MSKRLLTIDDLISYCQTSNFCRFDSKESGYKLSVQVPASFSSDEDVDDAHRGMCKLKIRIFHTGLNRNNSYVSEEAAREAMKTISDRPLLAAIHQLDNGEWDFESHEMSIVENEDGESEIEYIEKQVGSFSSEKPFIEHDDELDKDFICAYAYVAEEYTKCADIIRRKNGTKNSVELSIEEMSFNAKENYLSLDKFYVTGSTLLGAHSDGVEIKEGMQGSRADIVDFSADNNSIRFERNDELLERIKKLEEAFDEYKNSEKGGNEVKKFDELLEKYGKTLEDITFDYEGKTDEELEALFEEAFGTSEPEGESEAEEGEAEQEEAEQEQESPEAEKHEEESEEQEEAESESTFSINHTVTHGDVVKEFSISLNDKLNALSSLVNDTYSEDGTFYSVDVYEDDKYVLMIDCWSGKAYKQSFKCKKDQYMLVGDRVEMYSVWVTADEKAELERMKSNYSSIEDKLAKYEAEPEKISILSEEGYSCIAGNEKFVEILNNHFDLSVEDVRSKADAILLECVKTGKFSFENKKATSKPVFQKTVVNSRYGDLFAK